MGRTGGDELEDNLLLEPEVGDADVCLERPSQSKKRKKQDLCAAEKDSRPVRAKAKASRKVNAGPEEEQPGQLDVARSQKKAKKRRSEAPSNTSRWDSSSLHGASPAHVASYFNETYFQEKRFAQVQRAEKEIPKEKFLDLCKSPHTTEGLGDHLKSLYPQWQSKFKTSPRDTKGRPVVLLVCSSAIRAVEIFKALRDFNALGRIGKLFAKHFKVSEQIEFLTSTPIRLAIGTPNRLAKLIDEGALSLRDTETLLIDCARDKKQMTVFEINDLRRDLFELIDMHALPCIQKAASPGLRVCLREHTDQDMNQERLARLQALQSQVRTGGKGTVRRKKKSARHGAALDEKKLQMTMKKMNMTPLPGIDTVNMFREDEKVLHFRSPKVGAAPTGSTLSVTGVPEIRDLKDMMPDIIAEMGIPRNLLEMLAKQRAGKAEGGADADDDVPELIEDFEAQARRPEAAAGV